MAQLKTELEVLNYLLCQIKAKRYEPDTVDQLCDDAIGSHERLLQLLSCPDCEMSIDSMDRPAVYIDHEECEQ